MANLSQEKQKELSNFIDKRLNKFWKKYLESFGYSTDLMGRSDEKDTFDMGVFIKSKIKKQLQERLKGTSVLASDDFNLKLLVEDHLSVINLLILYSNKDKNAIAELAKKYAAEVNELKNKSYVSLGDLKKTTNKHLPTKGVPGRKEKYKTETQLHDAIRKIKGWELLSLEDLSLELGFSKGWLRGFINSEKRRGWSMPTKN